MNSRLGPVSMPCSITCRPTPRVGPVLNSGGYDSLSEAAARGWKRAEAGASGPGGAGDLAGAGPGAGSVLRQHGIQRFQAQRTRHQIEIVGQLVRTAALRQGGQGLEELGGRLPRPGYRPVGSQAPYQVSSATLLPIGPLILTMPCS